MMTLPTTQALADEFRREMRRTLTADQLEQIDDIAEHIDAGAALDA